MRNTRSLMARRWGGRALTLLLACALLLGLAVTASARGTWQGETVDPATPKPTVTIQGNLVTENGKPTGFYELALCVRSGYSIQRPNPAYATDKTQPYYLYATQAEYDAMTDADKAMWEIHYYPFRTATAALNINTDILTAVNWDLQRVTYEAYDALNGSYPKDATVPVGTPNYPRGIDTAPAVQGYTDLTQEEAFPDITTPDLYLEEPSVAVDVEADPRMIDAHGAVEHYENGTALLTLTVGAPDNTPIILTESTPLVVARFAYDLKRFPTTKVNTTDWAGNERSSATGDKNDEGFWMGWDKTTGLTGDLAGKAPLTWLGESVDSSPAGFYHDFTATDELVSMSLMSQSVWVHMGTDDPVYSTRQDTYYYYYLGAEEDQSTGAEKLDVDVWGVPQSVANITIPNTVGERVLTEAGELPAGAPAAPYTFFQNLLRLRDETLALELVNQPTFKKATGGFGGNQILFYDWDDTLIGSLIVGDGDVREAVNTYVEQNLVHPDLRASTVLNGTELNGTAPDFSTTPAAGSDAEKYQKLITSLDREYTYRGSYDSIPGGGAGSVSYPEKGEAGYDPTKAGSSYPLTNKLDYAFYRHLNTVTAIQTQDTATGRVWTENYFTLNDLTADETAALYPWAYGWAIVSDPDNTTLSTKSNWPVMVDSAKLDSTWTTFRVGELADQDPAAGNTQTSFAAPVAVAAPATNPTVTYPGGLSADWSTDAAKHPMTGAAPGYTYKTSSADANGYLRFADFSDINKCFEKGQNVLIVKAVYEGGSSIYHLGDYTLVPGSLTMKRDGVAASTENGIYSFSFQYQRANDDSGTLLGVRRIREPALKTGFIFDAKSVDDAADLSQQGTFYMKNLATTGDIVDVNPTTGGNLWKMDYLLVDTYGGTIGEAQNRSAAGSWGADIKDNFLYDETDPKYDERQGTDGFVTELTINTLLAEATKAARGEDNKLSNHASLATIQDLNLKKAAGEPPAEYSFLTASRVATIIENLVKRLYDDNVSIDPKTGNVTLTWHQLQRHILMCEAANNLAADGIYSGGTLMTDGQCKGFAWCRMDACAGDVKMDLNSFNDVLKAIHMIQTLPSGDNDRKKAQEALYGDGSSTGISGATLAGYGFRTQADGVPYDPTLNDAQLKTAILADLNAVVSQLAPGMGAAPDWTTVTWTQVQEEIIRDNMTDPPAVLDLWWDPANYAPPAIDSWDELWDRSIQTFFGVDLDGDGTIDANTKISDAFDGFDQTALDALVSEKPGTSTATNVGWLRTGGITVVDGEETADKFTPAGFVTAWEQALRALTTAPGPYTPATVKTATWEEIQWALIEGSYRPHADIFNDADVDYWWKDGGKPKLTYEKFKKTMQSHAVNGPSSGDMFNVITSVEVVSDQLRFRKDEYGSEFTSTDEFLQAAHDALGMLSLVTNRMDYRTADDSDYDISWEEFQWLLIHNNEIAVMDKTPTDENSWTGSGKFGAPDPDADFWWKVEGGTPPQTPITVNSISSLLQGAKWTWDIPAVNDQALQGAGLLNDINALHLRKANGVPFASNAEFLGAMENAYKALLTDNGGGYTLDTITKATWKEVQYALINGAYKPDANITDDYWWQDGNKPALSDLASLLKAAWYANQGAADALDNLVVSLDGVTDPAVLGASLDVNMVNTYKDPEPLLRLRQNNDGAAWPADASGLNALKNALKGAVTVLTASPAPYTMDTLGTAPWEEVQYAVINGSYRSAADIAADATIDYWWKTEDVKPGSGPAIKPLGLDWDSFLSNANYYMDGRLPAQKNKLKTFLTSTGLTEVEAIRDSLLLRSGPTDADTFAAYADFTSKLANVKKNILAHVTVDSKGNTIYDSGAAVGSRLKMSYAQMQWALLNCDNAFTGTAIPSDDEIDMENLYPWRYEAPPRAPEELADPADWANFLSNANYYMDGRLPAQKNKLKTFLTSNGLTEVETIRDTLLLRAGATDADTFAAYADFTSKLSNVKKNILAHATTDTAGNTVYNSGAGMGSRLNMSWWQMQWALLNCDNAFTGTAIPSDDDLKADLANNNYTWKFVDGYTGVEAAGGAAADELQIVPEPAVSSGNTESAADRENNAEEWDITDQGNAAEEAAAPEETAPETKPEPEKENTADQGNTAEEETLPEENTPEETTPEETTPEETTPEETVPEVDLGTMVEFDPEEEVKAEADEPVDITVSRGPMLLALVGPGLLSRRRRRKG